MATSDDILFGAQQRARLPRKRDADGSEDQALAADLSSGDDVGRPTLGGTTSAPPGKDTGTISASGGDDDDLEELEVQRMTAGDDVVQPSLGQPGGGVVRGGPGTISAGDDDDLEELEVQRMTAGDDVVQPLRGEPPVIGAPDATLPWPTPDVVDATLPMSDGAQFAPDLQDFAEDLRGADGLGPDGVDAVDGPPDDFG